MIAEGCKYGLDEEFVRSIFEIIHAESIHNQLEAYNKKREPEA
jgi:chorismate mutase